MRATRLRERLFYQPAKLRSANTPSSPGENFDISLLRWTPMLAPLAEDEPACYMADACGNINYKMSVYTGIAIYLDLRDRASGSWAIAKGDVLNSAASPLPISFLAPQFRCRKARPNYVQVTDITGVFDVERAFCKG
jgi:hypothetical protein